MMNSKSDDIADRPRQYSLRQLGIAVSICSMAIQVGLTAAVLLALIAVQAICFLLFESLRTAGEPADQHIRVAGTPRFPPFEQNE